MRRWHRQVRCDGLVAATHVLIPTQAEHLASIGIRALLGTLGRLRRGLNPDLAILGVLPTMYNPRQVHDGVVLEGLQEMMRGYGIRVFEPIKTCSSVCSSMRATTSHSLQT